jgi:hypothetical protein
VSETETLETPTSVEDGAVPASKGVDQVNRIVAALVGAVVYTRRGPRCTS